MPNAILRENAELPQILDESVGIFTLFKHADLNDTICFFKYDY